MEGSLINRRVIYDNYGKHRRGDYKIRKHVFQNSFKLTLLTVREGEQMGEADMDVSHFVLNKK